MLIFLMCSTLCDKDYYRKIRLIPCQVFIIMMSGFEYIICKFKKNRGKFC